MRNIAIRLKVNSSKKFQKRKLQFTRKKIHQLRNFRRRKLQKENYEYENKQFKKIETQ